MEGASRESEERAREAARLAAQLDSLARAAEERVLAVRDAARDMHEAPGRVGGVSTAARPWQLTLAQAQDSLAALRQLRRRVELLIAEEQAESGTGASGIARTDEAQAQEGTAAATLERLDSSYARLRKDLQQAQAEVHSAPRSSREQHLLAQRARLLGHDGAQTSLTQRRALRTEEERAGAATDITQTMRRTQHVMAQEVQRGLGTLEVMDDSSATLQRSGQLYTSQKGKLGAAQGKLTNMQRRDRQDRAILVLGLAFFLLVCFYILHARVPLLRRATSTALSTLASLFRRPTTSQMESPTVGATGFHSDF